MKRNTRIWVAFSVLALRLALQFWGYAQAFARNLPQPIAVPLPLTIEQQAAEEARHVSDGEI